MSTALATNPNRSHLEDTLETLHEKSKTRGHEEELTAFQINIIRKSMAQFALDAIHDSHVRAEAEAVVYGKGFQS